MSELFPRTNRDTLEVLSLNGCEVLVPQGQGCCGALHLHGGDAATALRLARRNVEAFGRVGVDVILTNSAGCGSTLKEYSGLLAGGQAQTFGVPVRDVQEFLADIGLSLQPPEYRMTVTYQDACHLAHGQRIREQPRTLLTSIPGLTLTEMENADWCCGSAGTYNLEHPRTARALLNEKVEAIARTGADVVAVANPGCLMQLSAGVQAAQLPIRVQHPMAILAAAYRRESPQHPRDSYV